MTHRPRRSVAYLLWLLVFLGFAFGPFLIASAQTPRDSVLAKAAKVDLDSVLAHDRRYCNNKFAVTYKCKGVNDTVRENRIRSRLDSILTPLSVVPPTPAPTTLTLAPVAASIAIAGTVLLTPTILDQFGHPISATVGWGSSAPTVATVSNGVVIGVAAGVASIIATSGTAKGAASITVTAPVQPPSGNVKLFSEGARVITAGDSVYWHISTQGAVSGVKLTTTGLPPGASLHLYASPENNWTGPPADFVAYNEMENSFVLTAAPTTPLGKYTITLTASGSGGTAAGTVGITIAAMPAVLAKQPLGADIPLAGLAAWRTTMTTQGARWCDTATTPIVVADPSVYYYDGARVYYQIGDYTGNHAVWNDCAARVLHAYRPYALAGPTPYRIFPHGLRQDFSRNGNTESKRALDTATTHSALATYVKWSVSWAVSRETAYGIDAGLEELALGQTTLPNAWGPFDVASRLSVLKRIALGHIDQWFVSGGASYIRPFMVGLTAEALIAEYQQRPDPRIPALLKVAADSMWKAMWIPNAPCTNSAAEVCPSFMYTNTQANDGTGGTEPAADLNLLIAPLYGWLYQQTGDVKYRTIGDSIFNSGVHAFPPYQGKQFSQSYRWSFDYLKWRAP